MENDKVINRAVITMEWQNGRKDQLAEIVLTLTEKPEITMTGLRKMRRRMGWEMVKVGLGLMIYMRRQKHDKK